MHLPKLETDGEGDVKPKSYFEEEGLMPKNSYLESVEDGL